MHRNATQTPELRIKLGTTGTMSWGFVFFKEDTWKTNDTFFKISLINCTQMTVWCPWTFYMFFHLNRDHWILYFYSQIHWGHDRNSPIYLFRMWQKNKPLTFYPRPPTGANWRQFDKILFNWLLISTCKRDQKKKITLQATAHAILSTVIRRDVTNQHSHPNPKNHIRSNHRFQKSLKLGSSSPSRSWKSFYFIQMNLYLPNSSNEFNKWRMEIY